MAVSASFWTRRRVLVTGHTGFKGSWLALWLQQLGAQVIGFSVGVPTSPSLFELADVDSGMQSIIGDVRDQLAVSQVIADAAPDVIVHLAAQAVVLRGYEDPVQTFETNVGGTVNVLEAIRQTPSVRAALIVTSDKCYRPSESSVPHSEDDPLGGTDPYSGSKACAELVTQAYRASYFSDGTRQLALATARAGNVIGGGDWTPHRIVPDLIRAFAAGQPVLVRNPQHIRPWQHVLDPLAGYLMLCERLFDSPGFSEAWNFGPITSGWDVPVALMVEKAAAVWGGGASWQNTDDSSPLEASGRYPTERRALRLDATKAVQRLGWHPRLDLETSVRWTIEWYQRLNEGRSARKLTLDQIETYAG